MARTPRDPAPAASDKAAGTHAGDWAESLACDHLRAQGLALVARNWRCPRGEIDLVMTHGQTLVFVEVRQRRHSRFGSPAETIGTQKRERLRRAAEHYLLAHPDARRRPCRMDVVTITGEAGNHRIEWLSNAIEY
jgi:putative endonuclease